MRRRTDRAGPAAPRDLTAQLRRALAEDRVDRDATSRALGIRGRRVRAEIVAQAPGIASGIRVAVRLAQLRGIRATALVRDGARVARGRAVVRLVGDAASILGVERTALNYLMHLSGVATQTDRAVRAAGGRLVVLGTRKTTPGLRDLEKAAIVHGGGRPHRRDLSDALLVKNNHLALVPLRRAAARAVAGARGRPVEVEVRSYAQARAAVESGARRLLLDNRTPAAARAIVQRLAAAGLRRGVEIELSGGITVATLRRFRGVGADAVSLGSLTHSAPAVPYHLVARPLPPR